VSTVTAVNALPDGWNTVTAKITANSKLLLLVNGQQVAAAPLKDFIHKEPNDTLDIGGDGGSQILASDSSAKFTGLIESVKVSSE
jgi:hypothetical protein